MENKNAQKAGNNSNQLQLTNCNVYFNITEEKLDEIVNNLEVLNTLNNNGAVVQKKIEDRKEIFVKKLLPELIEDEALDSLKEPEVVKAIKETIAQAVCTDNDKNYDLLLKLLRNRIKHSNDSLIALSLKNATEAANYISYEALLGLSVFFMINHLGPRNGIIKEGLSEFNEVFKSWDLNSLPKTLSWIDHLYELKLVNLNSINNRKKVDDCYCDFLNGYVCTGIKLGSEDYLNSIELLTKANIPKNILINNELISGYVRLPIVRKEDIDSMDFLNFSESKMITNSNIIQIFNKIFEMYEKNDGLLNDAKNKFKIIWNSNINLAKVSDWCDNFQRSFYLTNAGKAMAYANINYSLGQNSFLNVPLNELIK